MRWEERKVEGVERKGEDADALRMLKKVGAREGEVIAVDS